MTADQNTPGTRGRRISRFLEYRDKSVVGISECRLYDPLSPGTLRAIYTFPTDAERDAFAWSLGLPE